MPIVTGTTTRLDVFSADWAHLAWTDFWQGSCLALAVWLVCKYWPAMPARGRAWLWCLVATKFVVGFLPFNIPLPILPAPPSQVVGMTVTPESVPAWKLSGSVTAVTPVSQLPSLLEGPGTRTPAGDDPGPTEPSPATILLAIWMIGVCVGVGKAVIDWERMRAIRRRAKPIRQTGLSAECRRLCFLLGIERLPVVLAAENLSTPLLTGIKHPVVILPDSVAPDYRVHEMRMLLAHELAHLKRRDLVYGWIPTTALILSWFNPVVWLAVREWRLAQEIACDQLAVEVTASAPAQLGKMVLTMSVQSPAKAVGSAAVGFAAPHDTLKRRLTAMRYIGKFTRPGSIAMPSLLICVGMLVIPWRLAAQPQLIAEPPPSAVWAVHLTAAQHGFTVYYAQYNAVVAPPPRSMCEPVDPPAIVKPVSRTPHTASKPAKRTVAKSKPVETPHELTDDERQALSDSKKPVDIYDEDQRTFPEVNRAKNLGGVYDGDVQ